MDLQAWDNIVSIASNSITTIGVIAGLIFGGKKVNEYFKTKMNDAAFISAVNLYEEVVNVRERHGRVRLLLNYALGKTEETLTQNRPIDLTTYIEIERIGLDSFEASLSISKCFTRASSYGNIIKPSALEELNALLDISNKMTNTVNSFFGKAISASTAKVPNQEELGELRALYKSFAELQLEYNEKCSNFQNIKFKDAFYF
ncbi:hypothetical protein IGG09_001692 [Escherichia coli]|uniref:hypothetical protein n=1 Tax=Escherichia TaxID=561 RepID=UPI0015946562|nr:hypothetical protein [Escherichia sp. 79.0191]EII4821114.1 hypothetical protein [Escherichia coli]EKF3357510.1 hypothetical protein [Escherichia coli]MBB2225874.1 hypothetical protein [Escherichia sp. 79.0191]MED0390656.1 hypothetical protein [Escherichia coli]HDQ0026050.1 hypothetical protein [Escherichia coli]